MGLEQIDKKLTTRNILALSTVGVFLYAVIFSLQNPEQVLGIIDEAPKGVILGGGIIIGTFVAVVKDVFTFFFRKKPENET